MHILAGGTGVCGATGVAFAPHVLLDVTHELHTFCGFSGLVVSHVDVRRCVIDPDELAGQAKLWVSVSGAHKPDCISPTGVKLDLSELKRNPTSTVLALAHWVEITPPSGS